MDKTKKLWTILQELDCDLANRVQSFMVTCWNFEVRVMLVTENGELYWLRKVLLQKLEFFSKYVPELTALDVPAGVVQMAQGHNNYILLLNKRGEIYSMGRNYHGQLGLGSVDQEWHFTPQLIHSPHKFISVRCGLDHSLALTEDGKVFGWGENHLGQVGVVSSVDPIQSPSQIPGLDLHRIVAVECGGCHSMALTDRGEVYAWGDNYRGQLGYGSETSPTIPIRIPAPSPVRSMAAGYFHTLLLTRAGEVYACGENENGQLGLPPTTEYSLRLSMVAGLPPSISQIASHPGTNLSIAMSSDQRCFVWGELRKGSKFLSTPRELPPEYSTVDSPLSTFSRCQSNPHSVSIPVTPPSQLSTRMSRMFDNPDETSSDVQFVVEQRTIHAHRCILSNSSDYFARMFSERWRMAPVDPENPIIEVTITDHSYPVFHAFLRFLYTNFLKVHSDLLIELFELASLYLVPDLQKLCLSRLRINLTLATCCLYYSLTHRHSLLPELATFQQELVQFISTRTLEVYGTAAYRSMESDLRHNLTNSVQNFQNP